MTVMELLARTRHAVGNGIKYKLGAGGMNPLAPLPCNDDNECDCSGDVSWALGVSRYMKGIPWYDKDHNGEWLNTDAIWRDARSTYGIFEEIGTPKPGAIIVYPKRSGLVAGHVGILTAVNPNWVIHCSSGNYRATGDAIQETGDAVFQKYGAIYCWCAWVESA